MNIWQELRRRRVFRVAGIYVVGAWLVIQVADILFPAWGLPETAVRFLFIGASAGFPIALVFGWLFDITPQGIVRTEPASHVDSVDLSLKRADYLILVALVAVGIAILVGSLGGIREELESGPDAADIDRRSNSIAVLPFVNLDPNPDTAYFSDGVTEEILHRLSTLGRLHVLASTSSFAFRDTDLGPADITDRLGVGYLLQGSVRRDADQVRVTARLLDETGFQLWSENFDRKLEGIFTIQSEIAHAVASHIVREIVPMHDLPAGRTTSSMEAYNSYLSGKAWLDQRTPGWQEQAEAAFRRAIELDAEYAPPYAGLAAVITIGKGPGPHFEEGRILAEKAVSLDPEFAFGNATLGLMQTFKRDFEEGALSLRRALELDPSLALAWGWLGYTLRMLERYEEADDTDERGLEIDPLNPILVLNASESAQYKGNFERAEALLRRLTTLPQPPVYVFQRLAALQEFRGQFAQAIASTKQQIRIDSSGFNLLDLAIRYARLGMFDEADYWYELGRRQLPAEVIPMQRTWEYSRYRGESVWLKADLRRLQAQISGTSAESEQPHFNQHIAGGYAFIRIGDYADGIDYLERGVDLGIKVWRRFKPPDDPAADIDPIPFLWERWWYPGVTTLFTHLAFAYRQVGREEDANLTLSALADLEWSSDHADKVSPELWSPAYLATNLGQRALLRSLSGDHEGALEDLERAIELGWYAEEGGYYDALNDPAWAAMIAQPAVQALLEKARAKLERQRSIIRASDDEHDFRAEIEAML